MFPSEFLEILFENQSLFIICTLFCAGLYFVALRHIIGGLFDPLLLPSIFSVFASSVVLFLYFKSEISLLLFLHFLATQSLFYISLYYFSRKYPQSSPTSRRQVIPQSFLSKFIPAYGLLSAFHIFFNFALFFIFGFPIFMESRLNFFHSEAGIGIFSRMFAVSGPLTFLLSVIYLSNWNRENPIRRFIHIAILALNLSICILSADKSAFLLLPFSLFYFNIFFSLENQSKFIGKALKWFCIGGAAAIPVLILTFTKSASAALLILFQRIALSGDVFILGYPNNVIFHIDSPGNPLLVLFQDQLGMIRILPWSSFPPSLGEAIFKYHFTTDAILGPNPRHNIFGLWLFGPYLSLVYSFLLGGLLGFLRGRLTNANSTNLILKFLFILVLINIANIETDVQLIMANITNQLLFFPFLFILPLIITSNYGLSVPDISTSPAKGPEDHKCQPN